MSAYIYCPECHGRGEDGQGMPEETLDVDTLRCNECGYYPGRKEEKRISELETEITELRSERRREHDLRCQISGELETVREENEGFRKEIRGENVTESALEAALDISRYGSDQ